MPILEETQFVHYEEISTRNAREISLREAPAIYSWYREFGFLENINKPEDYCHEIENLISVELSARFKGKVGPLYEVVINESGGNLSINKKEILQKISRDTNSRKTFNSLLKESILFQSPLYIGKSGNLRRRIGDHLSGDSGLAERFFQAGIKIEHCVIAYRYMTEDALNCLAKPLIEMGSSKEKAKDAVVTLIEEVLTRVAPASFVRRIG